MASQVANNWKETSAYGTHNFSSDVFRIICMEPGFAFSRSAHEVYADVLAFELPTLYGYTVGGSILAGVAIVNDAVLAAAIITWNNMSWVVAGGDLQVGGAIIFDDTVAAPDIDPIVGFIDFGGTLTTYNGGTFTIANIAVAYT